MRLLIAATAAIEAALGTFVAATPPVTPVGTAAILATATLAAAAFEIFSAFVIWSATR